MRENEKIKQIIPATGWRAIFARHCEDGKPYQLQDVVCWALVREENEDGVFQVIKGLTSSDVPAWIDDWSFMPNFIGYVGPLQDPETWRKSCEEYLAKEKSVAVDK